MAEDKSRTETFNGIHLDISKDAGRLRIAEFGMGWKPASTSDTSKGLSLETSAINQASWSKSAKGYEMRIISKAQGVIQLDGFKEADHDRLKKCLQVLMGLSLDSKEHSVRGWNWGKAELDRNEITFNVRNQPAFEIPYSEIANTNLAGKNEVAVQLAVTGDGQATGTDGKMGGAKAKGRKGGGATDQLVEMRFYVPGTATTRVAKEGGEDGEVESDDENADIEEQNAASLFYDTLADKAEIGAVAGDTYATFLEVLHLTPRGRFDLDMYESSFRMRGKTYDYKVSYESVKKIMQFPKPDDTHMLLVLGLDPPLRQGQTTYPFLVMQFRRDEEVELELNMEEELIKTKYEGKLQKSYEAPLFSIVGKVFTGLSGRKIALAAKDFESHHNQKGVKCSVKASEGFLFCLESAFMFVPKPAQYVIYKEVSLITLSRVGGAVSASRTFDIRITNRSGGEFNFSNINREEQRSLEDFFALKGLKVRNEMLEDNSAILQAALQDGDLASSDDDAEVVNGADRGSAAEDSEEDDEDFEAGSESDPAEEFDSDAESEGSGDEEMGDAGSDDDEDSRPKKKSKTGK